MANYLGKYLNKSFKDRSGARGYWYAYEWIHRKWRAFGKEMFKLGESVTATEYELIHGISAISDRLKYMNWRLEGAFQNAVGKGILVLELVQFLITGSVNYEK